MRRGALSGALRRVLHHLSVATGAAGLTLAFFLVLPLMQAIATPPAADLLLTRVDVAQPPPPPPPQEEEEPEEEPEPEEPPPELSDPAEPLDLAQLELALHPGIGGDWGGGALAASLAVGAPPAEQTEALLEPGDLDQRPRVVYQPSPVLDDRLRKRAPATVHLVFEVDERGRVVDPLVLQSTDPAFERPALGALKQWQFEPGRSKGRPVRFRMRVPITFPAGS